MESLASIDKCWRSKGQWRWGESARVEVAGDHRALCGTRRSQVGRRSGVQGGATVRTMPILAKL